MKSKISQIKLEHPDWGCKRIAKLIGCSHNTVRYHLDPEVRKKSSNRQKAYKSKHQYCPQAILKRKIDQFLARAIWATGNGKNTKRKIANTSASFTVESLLQRMKSNPICYLTGDKIDFSLSKSFELDHIIPASLGGASSLDNCGISTREANRAKGQLSLPAFIALCQKVLIHNGFQVTKS